MRGGMVRETEALTITPPSPRRDLLARVTLVVPTYQEADNIERFLRAARAALPDARVIVCDDGGSDGTGAIADRVGRELGNVEVLHRPSKQGLGNAYRHGFRVALDGGADIVVQMDADFSHPHAMLPAMVGRLRAGADVVIGSRYVPGGGTPDWPVHRRLLSKGGNRYARRLLHLAVRDATSGLRGYRAGMLQEIGVGSTQANGYGFMLETIRRLTASGARVEEVPLLFRDRVAGTSKMSARIVAENLLLVTWWGVSLRYPGAARAFRTSAAGRRLSDLAARLS